MSEAAGQVVVTKDDCIFCRIVAGELPSRTVYADDTAVAFLDLSPWHRGHTLVVPRTHVDDVRSAGGAFAAIGPAVEAVARLVTERLGCDGVNVTSSAGEVAGQDVFHLHVHIVPRYADKPGIRALHDIDADASPEALDAVLAELT